MPVSEGFRLRSLTPAIFVPNFLFSVGQGAVVPVVALLALDLGAGPALAGLVVALRGLGTLLFDVPAGVLVSRFGEKPAMVVSGAVLAAISIVIWTRPSLLVYSLLIALMGCTWAVWLVARIAYAAGSAPVEHRGRTMASIGGVHRIGQLVGPLLGSLVLFSQDLSGPFLILAILSLAAAVSVAIADAPSFVPEPAGGRNTVVAVLSDHRRTLVTAGWVAVSTQILRSSREALIPLWGDAIGAGPGAISLIFAAAAAIESMIFYPVGILMDRKGRKWTAVPSIVMLSIGIALIPLAGDVVALTVVAMVVGVGNGLGSGMNMTMGSDLAPSAGRSVFLGVWRVVTDVGTMGGPLVVAGVTTVISLGAAAVVVGALGGAGVFVLLRSVPETLARP